MKTEKRNSPSCPFQSIMFANTKRVWVNVFNLRRSNQVIPVFTKNAEEMRWNPIHWFCNLIGLTVLWQYFRVFLYVISFSFSLLLSLSTPSTKEIDYVFIFGFFFSFPLSFHLYFDLFLSSLLLCRSTRLPRGCRSQCSWLAVCFGTPHHIWFENIYPIFFSVHPFHLPLSHSHTH